MMALGPEYNMAGEACCLKPADAHAMPPAGFGQKPGAPDVSPEFPYIPLTEPALRPVPSPQEAVGQSGVFAPSAFTPLTLQRPMSSLGNAQLQPLLALLGAAQHSRRGVLTRASSCEVPAGSGRKLPHKRTPNVLYKTELCRTWSATGQCRYGGKCQFAHGFHELRPVQRHPKYKTEVCRTFVATGGCPYGARCKFIHSRSSDVFRSDEVALGEPAAPAKAHSLPANFGSGAGIKQTALLNALCSLLATSQGIRTATLATTLTAGVRSPLMHSGGPLASGSGIGSYPTTMLSPESQLSSQAYSSSSTPFYMQSQGEAVQSKLSQAAALVGLLQASAPALSPFAQELGRQGLPAAYGSADMPSADVALHGAEVAISAHLPMWPPAAAGPSSIGLTPSRMPEACQGGMQGLWTWDGQKDNTSTNPCQSDPEVDPPPKTEAALPFYPAVAKRTPIPA